MICQPTIMFLFFGFHDFFRRIEVSFFLMQDFKSKQFTNLTSNFFLEHQFFLQSILLEQNKKHNQKLDSRKQLNIHPIRTQTLISNKQTDDGEESGKIELNIKHPVLTLCTVEKRSRLNSGGEREIQQALDLARLKGAWAAWSVHDSLHQ